jgi:type IV fimbrial biogenesis protein FimT
MQYISKSIQCPNQTRGVSLVELLTTIGIAGVLTAIALPSLGSLVSQFRESSMANAFADSVHRARSEAILRNARVVICKSVSGESCSTAGGWERGWILFYDANNNAALDPGEDLLQVQLFAPSKIRLSGNAPVANYISFTGLGVPKMLAGEFQAGTLTLCSQSADPVNARMIALSRPGNMRIYKAPLAQCN